MTAQRGAQECLARGILGSKLPSQWTLEGKFIRECGQAVRLATAVPCHITGPCYNVLSWERGDSCIPAPSGHCQCWLCPAATHQPERVFESMYSLHCGSIQDLGS